MLIQVHVDGRANRSVTNNKQLLTAFKNIKQYAIGGVSGEEALPSIAQTWVTYLGNQILQTLCL